MGLQKAWARSKEDLKIFFLVNITNAIAGLVDNIPEWRQKHSKLQKYSIVYAKMVITFMKMATVYFSFAPLTLSLLRKYYWNEKDAQFSLILQAE